MKPCVFRKSVSGDIVQCDNFHDIAHEGLLPAELCTACPFAREPNYENQCARLWVTKAQTGEYRPRPKRCGGCGTTKHRDSHDLQFVWPYWEGAAEGDELRWSIRSVEAFFDGKAKITLIGDKPDWYTGHVIRKKRVPPSKPHQCFRDMLSKVWFMASHAEIDAEFVWMMDDIYFCRSFSVEDVMTPRAEPFRPSDLNKWQLIKQRTVQALTDRGRTNHDYATHAPHYAEKDKLRAIFDEFDLHQDRNVLTWEILYGNTYRGTPQRVSPWFVRFNEAADLQTIQRRLTRATCFNHAAGCWNADMRGYLERLLPDPSTGETGETPGFFSRSKPARVVKRRPRHTHRAVIEAQQQ